VLISSSSAPPTACKRQPSWKRWRQKRSAAKFFGSVRATLQASLPSGNSGRSAGSRCCLRSLPFRQHELARKRCRIRTQGSATGAGDRRHRSTGCGLAGALVSTEIQRAHTPTMRRRSLDTGSASLLGSCSAGLFHARSGRPVLERSFRISLSTGRSKTGITSPRNTAPFRSRSICRSIFSAIRLRS
jgi:hypothetical protein